ncbi:MAG TPA: 2'-5' RNA ligase family protein [Allosphingosinicella sp.]|nr:2'-5' RNA ligase family protein [Allosphingosinicella sp.]
MSFLSFIRYFFAVRPDPSCAAEIGRVRDLAGPYGSPVTDDRLHTTLGIVAEVDRPVPEIPAWAQKALGNHLFEGFPFALTRLDAQRDIAILLPGGRQPGVKALQAGLFQRLNGYGVEIRDPRKYRPHMTLGYNPKRLDRRPIKPVGWFADQIVLIESWVGKGIHRTVGSWSLIPPAQYSFDFE